MKTAAKIKELLNEYYSSVTNPEVLKESAKLIYTPETNGKRWIMIMSDKANPAIRGKETAKIGALLKFKKGNEFERDFKNRYDFKRPERYYNPRTGDFGWGYEISSNISKPELEGLLKNLKTLIHDYNSKPDVGEPFDLETEKLTPDQIKVLGQTIKAVQDAIEINGDNPNPVVEEALSGFYKELQEAIQNDDVYEFLSNALIEASSFQKKNTFYPYEIENSLIIRFADPAATFAAPMNKWKEEGYKIKDGFEGGIRIRKGGGSYNSNIDKFKATPESRAAWEEYKRLNRLPQDLTIDQFKATGSKAEKYNAVSWGFNTKAIRKSSSYNRYGSDIAYVYTDTMIEAIPGVSQTPLTYDDDLGIKEEPIQSLEMKDKIDAVFNALIPFAEKSRINLLGINRADGDMNKLNELLQRYAMNKVSYWFKRNNLVPEGKSAAEIEEMFKGFAEAATFIVKRKFGLPTGTSKYKAALYGLDPSMSEDQNKQTIITAHYIIKDINQELERKHLTEIRKAIKNILFENIFNTAQIGGVLTNPNSKYEEDKIAVSEINELISNGTPEEDALTQIANKRNYRLTYLKKLYNNSSK